MSQRHFRPTLAEVSLGAFAANVRAFRDFSAPARIMAVLKADGYGHGAAALAPVALENGADSIGVSSIEEGLDLRAAGITAPILLFGSIDPLENFSFVLDAGLTPTVSSLESAQALSRVAAAQNRTANFHLEVDTGMGRIGLSPQGTGPLLDWVAGQTSVRLAGVYTHFASADTDATFTRTQLDQLLAVRGDVTRRGFRDVLFHAANSAGAVSLPDSRLDVVRVGIGLYGLPTVALPAPLEPVLTWRTSIVFQKRVPAGTPISYGRSWSTAVESDIATLPVGYADGVPRAVAGKAMVLVKGQRRPVVGRITMDHVMVDVTGTNSGVGDDVVLIGRQNGESITAADWAAWAGTISYEILTGISKRVPRVVTK